MTREQLKQMVIEHFLTFPNTSAKPIIKSGDKLGAGIRGQIAGMVGVLRDNKTLVITGGYTNDIYLSVKE
jgi:hypothetical protein